MPVSDSATVVGDERLATLLDNGKAAAAHPHPALTPPAATTTFLSATGASLTSEGGRPFFVPIDEKRGGLVGALERLDAQLVQAGKSRILTKKSPTSWTGRTVQPGEAGLYTHGGLPKVILQPGRYPSFPLGNWWARSWQGVTPLSSTVLTHNGLICVQVSQNQAAVICDPSNQVFVLKNGGFVSLSLEGSYRVLGVVDGVNLKNIVVDPLAGGKEHRVLGHYEEVTMTSGARTYVVATFLDIPANNCVILQRGDDLELLPAGQHCITNPNITVRGWFSKGESQLEMPTKDMYTKDQVPVQLRVYLRWQLVDPLKLCYHGYNTPYDSLKDKTLSVLTQIVAHLEYASMIKQRSFTPGDDAADGPDTTSAAFLDALRTRAMDDLHEASLEYGIVLKDLAVIDRKFFGAIAETMDKLTTRALQAQVEASNVDRENSNRVKIEEGSLQVAQVQALKRKTEADAAAYTLIANAKAKAEAAKIAALGDAEAVRIGAKAESEAIALRNEVDSSVKDPQARTMQLARNEVQRIAAYGDRAIFVPVEGTAASNVVAGYGLATGGALAK